MSSDLESFYVIQDWSVTNGTLVVRLVPDFFNTELVAPVVTVSIVNPSNTAEATTSLMNYKSEMLVDIKTDVRRLELWGEYDDEPCTIEGQEIQLARVPYSSQDLVAAIEQISTQLSSSQTENMRLRSRMNEVEQFVADLLNRAQAKKAMSSRSTSPSDAQIDALSRVLRRIRDASQETPPK